MSEQKKLSRFQRPVKFRVWDKAAHRWLTFDEAERIKFTVSANGLITIFDNEWATEDYELVRYTGLKDKNGVEIYEGDLLSSDHLTHAHNAPEIVTYSVFPIHGGYLESYGYTFDYKAEELEVIGNIHSNPELLGGSDGV